jgi:soluble lytic murein transglycosylase-like protein
VSIDDRRALRGRLTAMRASLRIGPFFGLAALLLPAAALAAEHVTLTNGYDMICDHLSADGAKTFLYLDSGSTNYIAVDSQTIASIETVAPLAEPQASQAHLSPRSHAATQTQVLSQNELHQLLTAPGEQHDLDVDLLASVIDAESARRVHARSRVGAEGLMQLMPGTARQLGVADPYAPQQNVSGGTAYLDALLTRYHDNLALALAAYNAGPAAVDRWHGIPPYRETRAYVARIIHEFNQRYAARVAAGRAAHTRSLAADTHLASAIPTP